MKEYVFYGILIIGCFLIAGGIVMGVRAFSNATTPVNVIEPVEGMQCVKIITADGAAVDCWKKEQNQ